MDCKEIQILFSKFCNKIIWIESKRPILCCVGTFHYRLLSSSNSNPRSTTTLQTKHGPNTVSWPLTEGFVLHTWCTIQNLQSYYTIKHLSEPIVDTMILLSFLKSWIYFVDCTDIPKIIELQKTEDLITIKYSLHNVPDVSVGLKLDHGKWTTNSGRLRQMCPPQKRKLSKREFCWYSE